MDLLFRPVFTRVKTPVMGQGSFPDRQSSFSTDDNNESEEGLVMSNRIRPTSRVSSYMGFRPATPPIPAPGTFPNLRNPDNVYHKPSGDQLAEMLKVVMMNQSTMDPVPVQYNSTILHVLEAYQDLRMQLIAKEEEIEVLKRSHTKDIKDFEELAAAWHQKEIDYKVEVKKLEVLLSKTEGGMESVAMARSRSVIHGVEKASDTIKRGIGTIKARNAARNSQDADVDPPDFGPLQNSVRSRPSFLVRDDRDSSANASFEFPRRTPRKRNTIDSQLHCRRPQLSEESLKPYHSPDMQTAKASPHDSDRQVIPTLTESQLQVLERQQAQEFDIALDSSTSGADSSSISYRSDFPAAHGQQITGLGILEKPLPEIPISAMERAKQTTLDKFLHASARQHSYSDPNTRIERGDEEALLARRMERDRAQRRTVDEHLDQRPSLPNPRDSGSNTTTSSVQEHSRRPRQTIKPEIKPKSPTAELSVTGIPTPAKPVLVPRAIQDHDQLSRMDSSGSSIVTAIRDNSGRSSANNSQAGRRKLNRNTGMMGSGSSDAVSAATTAAARAIAVSNKKLSPRESRMGSTSGSRKGSASGETTKCSGAVETRNDGESNKALVTTRATSVRSTNSSIWGE